MKTQPVDFEREAKAAMSGLTTTVDRRQLRGILDKYGDWFFWNGIPRVFRFKHLGVGVWKLWSEEQ